MAQDLVELHERIANCRIKIERFLQDEAKWVATAWRFREEPSYAAFLARPPREFDLYATLIQDVPTGLRSDVGMIGNEIRACLDGLACQLAIRNGKSTGGVYFPISADQAAFQADARDKIRKLSPADQTAIENCQPYASGTPLLRGLHVSDIKRKHVRLGGLSGARGLSIGSLVITAGSGAIVRLTNCDVGGVSVRDLKSQTTALALGQEALVVENVPVGLSVRPLLTTAFLEPPELSGMVASSTLQDLCDLVDEIISKFD